jgi:hypothetical protein
MHNNNRSSLNIAMLEIAEIIENNIDKLKDKPMELHYLKDIDTQVNMQVFSKHSNDKGVFYFRYFYCNLIEHIWFHLAGDASLRVSDQKTEYIVGKIIDSLNEMVVAIRGSENVDVYEAYTNLIFQYFHALNSEVEHNE